MIAGEAILGAQIAGGGGSAIAADGNSSKEVSVIFGGLRSEGELLAEQKSEYFGVSSNNLLISCNISRDDSLMYKTHLRSTRKSGIIISKIRK